MTTETPQPNPVDLAREDITKALAEPKFNSAKVIVGLDKLESALHDASMRPVDIFTELASHAISARDASTDKIVGQLFEVRAQNYTKTAALLTETIHSSPTQQLEAGQATTVPSAQKRASNPSNTGSLRGTRSSKG